MKYIYILLILLVLFMLVFLVTDDRCEQGYNALEKFTQVIQTKYICNDPNAKNKYTGKLGENQVIDNSYCSYENNVVCNRAPNCLS